MPDDCNEPAQPAPNGGKQHFDRVQLVAGPLCGDVVHWPIGFAEVEILSTHGPVFYQRDTARTGVHVAPCSH